VKINKKMARIEKSLNFYPLEKLEAQDTLWVRLCTYAHTQGNFKTEGSRHCLGSIVYLHTKGNFKTGEGNHVSKTGMYLHKNKFI
jgi:hypothetical protein